MLLSEIKQKCLSHSQQQRFNGIATQFNYTNFKLDKKQIEYILKGGAGNNNESLGSNSDKITKKNMAIKMFAGC